MLVQRLFTHLQLFWDISSVILISNTLKFKYRISVTDFCYNFFIFKRFNCGKISSSWFRPAIHSILFICMGDYELSSIRKQATQQLFKVMFNFLYFWHFYIRYLSDTEKQNAKSMVLNTKLISHIEFKSFLINY